jgi:SpoVK/Ycf46/Vps4 family AAA+-type ATPase
MSSVGYKEKQSKIPQIYNRHFHVKPRIKKTRAPNFSEKTTIPIPKDNEKGFPLLQIKENYLSFHDLIVSEEIVLRLEDIIKENSCSDILKSYGLKPKQKILLCGPPGTGKTLSSKIISSVMGYPLVYILFDSILSSYLGQTATNLRKIFDFIENGRWVVLFDEFDIIGKRRDDPYEHGEIKRVVNNFMQMIDNYEGDSILIAATNHQQLLDSAIWRRFDEIIYYELPNLDQRYRLFVKYLKVLKRRKDYDLRKLAVKTDGFSGADIAQVCADALRRSIINREERVSSEDIEHALNDQRRRKEIMIKV